MRHTNKVCQRNPGAIVGPLILAMDVIAGRHSELEADAVESEKTIKLHVLVVPKELRRRGLGTAYMKDLCAHADKTSRRILLTADTSFGATSKTRLKRFYKRFGFKENKGRYKDFTTQENMIRRPETNS